MKMRIKLPLFLLFLLILSCNGNLPEDSDKKEQEAPDNEKTWGSAQEVNSRLGRGINVGNTFESVISTQSPFVPNDIKTIAELGFTHVRLPVRWEWDDRSMPTAPYTIRPDFFKTIQSAVDTILKNKLHVILNMHHHKALFADPPGEKQRFLSQWEQISDYFKDYPDSLLFEIMNEPQDLLTSDLWNEYSNEAIQIIRKTNPKRCVLLCNLGKAGIGSLRTLNVPNDPYLILTLHYYNPFQFTHQGTVWTDGVPQWVGTEWKDTDYEREAVTTDFKFAIKFAKEKNIPVHIGEFGTHISADIDSRVKYARFLSRWFEQQNFSWSYWQWNYKFGIYDSDTRQYNQRLVDALTKDKMQNAFLQDYVTIYESNFSNGQNDGWRLTNNPLAKSTLNIANNKVTVSVTEPGTMNHHIRFMKTGVHIEEGKTYRLRFKAYSPDDDYRSMAASISKSTDPWTTYGWRSINIDKKETEYNLVFKSTFTDPMSRIVFSLGNAGNTRVILSEITLMEIK